VLHNSIKGISNSSNQSFYSARSISVDTINFIYHKSAVLKKLYWIKVPLLWPIPEPISPPTPPISAWFLYPIQCTVTVCFNVSLNRWSHHVMYFTPHNLTMTN